MRDINSLDDARIVIRQLADRLAKLETQSVDFHGRRITNASPSKALHDYVIREEVEQLVETSIVSAPASSVPDEVLTLKGIRPRVVLNRSGSTGYGRFAYYDNGGWYLTYNLSYNGTNWNLDDTSKHGIAIKVSSGAIFEATRIPPSANPVSFPGSAIYGTTTGILGAAGLFIQETLSSNITTGIFRAGTLQAANAILKVQASGGSDVFSVLKEGETQVVTLGVNAAPPSGLARPGEAVINVWLGVGTSTRTSGHALDVNGKVKVTDVAELANFLKLSGITASRALYLDSSNQVQSSTVTNTELDYLAGVTSAVQTQINGKAAKASITSDTIPLAKITGGGADGSISVSADGVITAYVKPT